MLFAHGIDPRYLKIAEIAQQQRIARLPGKIVDIRETYVSGGGIRRGL
jgi:hypothetical protein